MHHKWLVVVIATLVLAACTTKPSQDDGRSAFNAYVAGTVKGAAFSILSFDKTNGQDMKVMGNDVYLMYFTATVSFPDGYLPDCFQNNGAIKASCMGFINPIPRGSISHYSGTIAFQKSERGWLPHVEVQQLASTTPLERENAKEVTELRKAASVSPGFIGTKTIGLWQLICDAKSSTIRAGIQDVLLGRCRATLYYRRNDNPRMVLAAVTVRFLGSSGAFGVFVLVPPIVKKGDIIALNINHGELKLPVADCEHGVCVARGSLADSVRDAFLNSPGAQVIIPQPSGKTTSLPLPTTGLSYAVTAMRAAQ